MHVIERGVFSLKHITYNIEALIWVVGELEAFFYDR
jgi:hypothetical protein